MGNPINQNNNKDLILTSKGVKWEGPSIPCLDLCHGDTVNSVMFKIAEKVCKLVDDYEDLATLNYECIIDLCETENCTDLADPTKVSLKGIFQVLLNNDCKLKDLIDTIQNQITNISEGGVVLGSLQLKCVQVELEKICRDPENYTLNDLLQAYINILCDHDASLINLSSRVLTLEQLICSLQDTVVNGTYEEPTLTDPCPVNPVATGIHSTFTEGLAAKACDIEENLGTSSDVTNALAQACITDFLTDSDIIQSPTNLAQDEKNKWVVLCNVIDRLKDIEENCCAPTCDEIKIGFSLDAYDEGPPAEYTLKFNNGTGTFIPVGFTDCGSTITLTDQHNNTVSSAITITNNATIVVDVTSLFVTDPITAKIDTCFQHTNGLECVDCFVQTIPAQEAGCKICKLCATGGNPGDQIQLQYHTDADPNVQTVILTQGACLTFDLPDEAPTIDSITVLTVGSAIAITTDEDCDPGLVIPTPIAPTCWFFPLPIPHTIGSYDEVTDEFTVTDDFILNYDELQLEIGTVSLSGNTCDISPAAGLTTATTVQISPLFPVYTSTYITCQDVAGGIEQGDATIGPGTPSLMYFNQNLPFGLYLNVIGQNSTNPPFLKLGDDLTGKPIFIQGELTDPCPCP